MLKTKKEVDALYEKLKNAGYKEFTPPNFTHKFDNVMYAFQKRFDDETGKKFFIDVYIYNELIHPHTNESLGFAVEMETQLTFTKDDKPIDLQLFSGWTVEEAEEKIQEIWEKCGTNYYEKWQ